jgi:hypothetical protein
MHSNSKLLMLDKFRIAVAIIVLINKKLKQMKIIKKILLEVINHFNSQKIVVNQVKLVCPFEIKEAKNLDIGVKDMSLNLSDQRTCSIKFSQIMMKSTPLKYHQIQQISLDGLGTML